MLPPPWIGLRPHAPASAAHAMTSASLTSGPRSLGPDIRSVPTTSVNYRNRGPVTSHRATKKRATRRQRVAQRLQSRRKNGSRKALNQLSHFGAAQMAQKSARKSAQSDFKSGAPL